MSIKIPSFVICLLFLSMHACKARRLRDMLNPQVSGMVVPDVGMVQEGNRVHHRHPKQSHAQTDEALISSSSLSLSSSSSSSSSGGATPITEQLVSVSWHVHPPKNHQTPGFFSDYSKPRMRPPSHN